MARETWTSSFGFILAAAGSAIGLGNAWRFPYMAGQNGGGTFVLVYVLCVLLVGLPVLCAEMVIGRHTHRNIINAMGKVESLSGNRWVRYLLCVFSAALAVVFGSAHAWLPMALALFGIFAFAKKGFAAIGWLATGAALAILSYYAVIGGWVIDYIWRSVSGSLMVADPNAFTDYLSNPLRVCIGLLIFMVITAGVILGGIQSGIERMSKILMPSLFILLLVVIARSVTLPGAWDGIVFLFKPTAAAFSPKVVLMALGQAFFSLSLGMSIMVTYGSYLGREQNVLKSALCVGALDTCAALLCGLAIFPAVFATGQDPAAGPGLIFNVLPETFRSMWLGPVWATCFFIMLLIATVTSAISLLECWVTVGIERVRRSHRRGSRMTHTLWGLVGITLLGLLTAISTLDWSMAPWLEKITRPLMGELTFGNWLDTLDNFASNWCLPFAALAATLLVGWCWLPRRAAPELLAAGEEWTFPRWILRLWGLLVRWVAPIVIVLIFLNLTGFLNFDRDDTPPPPAEETVQPSSPVEAPADQQPAE